MRTNTLANQILHRSTIDYQVPGTLSRVKSFFTPLKHQAFCGIKRRTTTLDLSLRIAVFILVDRLPTALMWWYSGRNNEWRELSQVSVEEIGVVKYGKSCEEICELVFVNPSYVICKQSMVRLIYRLNTGYTSNSLPACRKAQRRLSISL